MVETAAQTPALRFWVAGRYDGNHIVVFFDAVKFKGTFPRAARSLAPPSTLGFLFQREIPAGYFAQLPKGPGKERFRSGDRYDLLMGDGRVATVTLTTPVGYVSDDEDDDPSYVGALAKVDEAAALTGTRGYYALRRHDSSNTASRQPQPGAASASVLTHGRTFAGLSDEPVRLDIQTQIAALLTERLQATIAQQSQATNLEPTLAVQTFRLADGFSRYYARVEWRAEGEPEGSPSFAMGAWIAPQGGLHILAVEPITSPYGFTDELPNLLNVVDLGEGSTGIIVSITGPGEDTLGLWEYHDGDNLSQMHLYQSLIMDD